VKRHGKQSQLSTSLGALVRKLDKKGGGAYLQTRAAQAWHRIAGPAVCAHTTGAHVRSGEMIVFVDSALWATELSALSEHYRTSINQELGQDLVTSVRFTVSRKVSTEKRIEEIEKTSSDHLTEDKVDPVRLSDRELAQIEASVASIQDDGLRRAVLRATVADLEWKKGLKARKDRETPREAL